MVNSPTKKLSITKSTIKGIVGLGVSSLVVIVGIVFLVVNSGRSRELSILSVVGEVIISNDDVKQGKLADIGRPILLHDSIQVGEASVAVLGVGENTRLTIKSGTELEIAGVSSEHIMIKLDHGNVTAEVHPNSPMLSVGHRGWGVKTADGSFVVAGDGSGTVTVQGTKGETVLSGFESSHLKEGQQVTSHTTKGEIIEPIPQELLLQVFWPEPQGEREITISGETGAFASVSMTTEFGEVKTVANSNGNFTGVIEVEEGRHSVRIETADQLGGKVTDNGEVYRDSTKPHLNSTAVRWEQ